MLILSIIYINYYYNYDKYDTKYCDNNNNNNNNINESELILIRINENFDLYKIIFNCWNINNNKNNNNNNLYLIFIN